MLTDYAENFQLFLSNPHCQHLFLAACTDNGFARMLEPYQYHSAREKVTLISTGHVGREIEKLGFNVTSWPLVFAPSKIPKAFAEIEAKKAWFATTEAAHNKSLGLVGIEDQRIRTLVMDAVPGSEYWRRDINRMIMRHTNHIGVRPQQPHQLIGLQGELPREADDVLDLSSEDELVD